MLLFPCRASRVASPRTALALGSFRPFDSAISRLVIFGAHRALLVALPTLCIIRQVFHRLVFIHRRSLTRPPATVDFVLQLRHPRPPRWRPRVAPWPSPRRRRGPRLVCIVPRTLSSRRPVIRRSRSSRIQPSSNN